MTRAYGLPVQKSPPVPGQRYDSVIYEINGLAVIVHFVDECVERSFITNSYDALDEETLQRHSWILDEACREFMASKGCVIREAGDTPEAE